MVIALVSMGASRLASAEQLATRPNSGTTTEPAGATPATPAVPPAGEPDDGAVVSVPASGETVVDVPPERSGFFVLGRGGPGVSLTPYGSGGHSVGGWLSAAAGRHTRSGAEFGGAVSARYQAAGQNYGIFVFDVSALARYVGMPASRWHPVGELSLGFYVFDVKGFEIASPRAARFAFGTALGGGFSYDLSDRFIFDAGVRAELMLNGTAGMIPATSTSDARGFAVPFDVWLTLHAGITFAP